MDEKYKEILDKALSEIKYYNSTDLRLNKKVGYMLNKNEYNEYLSYKENSNDSRINSLPLPSFNSKNLFYYRSNELVGYIEDYYEFFRDFDNYATILKDKDDVVKLLISNEIIGTLGIENVHTTCKQVLE